MIYFLLHPNCLYLVIFVIFIVGVKGVNQPNALFTF